MLDIGRICIKIAGRDAGLKCVVVDHLGEGYVMIDGQTRRRKCNINHLEPLNQAIKIRKGASQTEVFGEFKKLKIEVREKKSKKAKERPRRIRKKKEQPVTPEKKLALTKKKETVKTPKALEANTSEEKPVAEKKAEKKTKKAEKTKKQTGEAKPKA